jgi:hypothetical protein
MAMLKSLGNCLKLTMLKLQFIIVWVVEAVPSRMASCYADISWREARSKWLADCLQMIVSLLAWLIYYQCMYTTVPCLPSNSNVIISNFCFCCTACSSRGACTIIPSTAGKACC